MHLPIGLLMDHSGYSTLGSYNGLLLLLPCHLRHHQFLASLDIVTQPLKRLWLHLEKRGPFCATGPQELPGGNMSPFPPTPTENKAYCPLNGRCREAAWCAKCRITRNNEIMTYYDCCKTDFKARYNNHTQSLRHRSKRNSTELSKLV